MVGLTGGIGSGKSTVAGLLRQAGAVVIDADAIARLVVEPGRPALAQIVDRFGAEVLLADGRLDRPALAGVVFNDPSALADLEAITHPRIGEEIATRFAAIQAEEAAAPGVRRVVVLDHPLLVESGMAAGLDVVVVVEAPIEARVARLVQRGLDEADARARIAVQTDDASRRSAATHLIDNGDTLVVLGAQVAGLWHELLARAEVAE